MERIVNLLADLGDIVDDKLFGLGHPQYLSHTRISVSSIVNTNQKIFRNHHHTTGDLACIVTEVSQYRGELLFKQQRAALRHYQQSPDSCYSLSSSVNISDTDVLRTYKQFFDQMFFFGTLEERTFLVLNDASTKETGLEGYVDRTKFKWHQKYKQDSYTITILAKPSMTDRRKRLTRYLGVLLHEMVHCFLQIWSCRYGDCYEGLEQVGKTGHGYAFQQIAWALERAVWDVEFVNLKVNLHRGKSFARELIYWESQHVPRKLRERWGIKSRDLKWHMADVRDNWAERALMWKNDHGIDV